jgi:hypothetical protein
MQHERRTTQVIMTRKRRVGWCAALATIATIATIAASLAPRVHAFQLAPQVTPAPSHSSISPSRRASTWKPAAPVPNTAYRYGFAQDDHRFFVLTTSALHRYDTVTDVWTSLLPAPRPLQLPGVVHHEGKLYVAGGMDDGPTSELFIYDIATDVWTQGASLPSFSYGSAAGVYGGKMFVITGTSGQDLAIYDIATNTWTLGPPPPVAYRLGGHAQLGQYLYLIGGLLSTTSSVSRRLDMATVTWSVGPAWTPARGDFALVAKGTKLYALGGRVWNQSTPSAEVNELNVTAWPAGQWARRYPDLPSGRISNQAGFVTAQRIWSTGGFAAGSVPLLEHIYLDL